MSKQLRLMSSAARLSVPYNHSFLSNIYASDLDRDGEAICNRIVTIPVNYDFNRTHIGTVLLYNRSSCQLNNWDVHSNQ